MKRETQMRKLVLILLGIIAVATFFRTFRADAEAPDPGNVMIEPYNQEK
jgi:hypothetical protein